jgi:hypothetical protein
VNPSAWLFGDFRLLEDTAYPKLTLKQGIEDGLPFPFLAAWVATFEKVGFDEFSFSLGKITWVGFHRGRRSLNSFWSS